MIWRKVLSAWDVILTACYTRYDLPVPKLSALLDFCNIAVYGEGKLAVVQEIVRKSGVWRCRNAGTYHL